MQVYTDKIVENYQNRFRKKKSTTDHIFVIRQIMEKRYEFTKDLHMIFVDDKKAYNNIVLGKMVENSKTLRGTN